MTGQTVWLPEPVATETADQKIRSVEILSYSMMVLLEHLNPRERAVFILKEAFAYSHEEVSKIFDISAENSRQLLSRAKNSLKAAEPDKRIGHAPPEDFLMQYVEVIRTGEISSLEEMLSEEITAISDGGGKLKVLREFCSGSSPVAQLTARVYALYLRKCRIEFKSINFQPALIFFQDDRLVCCQVLDISAQTGKIDHIFNVVDPQKLKRLQKITSSVKPAIGSTGEEVIKAEI